MASALLMARFRHDAERVIRAADGKATTQPAAMRGHAIRAAIIQRSPDTGRSV